MLTWLMLLEIAKSMKINVIDTYSEDVGDWPVALGVKKSIAKMVFTA